MGVKVKKQRKVVSSVKPGEQERTKSELSIEQMERSISALFQLRKKQHESSKKKSLFNDDPQPIILQIISFKIPVTPNQQIRIALPHPLHAENADVCLIVKDVKFATKTDTDRTVLHYKKMLDEKKVKGITKILPRRQLINEHKPYEAKGRFARLYDCYLIDGQLLGLVSNIVGSRFFRCNKHLVPLNMQARDLKAEVQRALSKTVLKMHGKGDTYSVQVATTNFTEQQVKENILAVVDVLSTGKFPGGFHNIHRLHVKTTRSMAIPVYVSFANRDSVVVPTVLPNLPRAYKPVTGELSTFTNKRVTVYPDGTVVVEKKEQDESEDDSSEYEEASDDGQKEYEKLNTIEEEAGIDKKHKDSDDNGSEDEMEAAEDAYLSELHHNVQLDDQPNKQSAKKTGKRGTPKAQPKQQPSPKKQRLDTLVKLPEKVDAKNNSEAKQKKQQKMESKKLARKQKRALVKETKKKQLVQTVSSKTLDNVPLAKSLPKDATATVKDNAKKTKKSKSKDSLVNDLLKSAMDNIVVDTPPPLSKKSEVVLPKQTGKRKKQVQLTKRAMPEVSVEKVKLAKVVNVKSTTLVRAGDSEIKTKKVRGKESNKLLENLLHEAKKEIKTPGMEAISSDFSEKASDKIHGKRGKKLYQKEISPKEGIAVDPSVSVLSNAGKTIKYKKGDRRLNNLEPAKNSSRTELLKVSPPLKQLKVKSKQDRQEKLEMKKSKAAAVSVKQTPKNNSPNEKSAEKKKKMKKVK